jgi:hypothetical protein
MAPNVKCLQWNGPLLNFSTMIAVQQHESQPKPQVHTAGSLNDMLMQQKRSGTPAVEVDAMTVFCLFILCECNDLVHWPDHAACSPAVYAVPGFLGDPQPSTTSYIWVLSVMYNKQLL